MQHELSSTRPLPAPPAPFSLSAFLVRRRVNIMLCTAIGLGIMLTVRHYSPPRAVNDFSDPWTIVGNLLVVSGLLIRSWAASILRKGQVLATKGPYSACRHPLYAGSSLMVLGFCVLLGDIWTAGILLAVMMLTYPSTVNHEERLISGRFSSEWPAYAAATPRLFPPRFPTGIGPASFAQWFQNREYQAVLVTGAALVGLEFWRWMST